MFQKERECSFREKYLRFREKHCFFLKAKGFNFTMLNMEQLLSVVSLTISERKTNKFLSHIPRNAWSTWPSGQVDLVSRTEGLPYRS